MEGVLDTGRDHPELIDACMRRARAGRPAGVLDQRPEVQARSGARRNATMCRTFPPRRFRATSSAIRASIAATTFAIEGRHEGCPIFRALTFDCYGTLIDWESGLLDGASGPHHLRAAPSHARRGAARDYAAHEQEQQHFSPTMKYSQLLAVVYKRLSENWGAPAPWEECTTFAAIAAKRGSRSPIPSPRSNT